MDLTNIIFLQVLIFNFSFQVCLLAAVFSVGVAIPEIPWSYDHPPFIHGSSIHPSPSYEAHKNHIKAKYYAKRAHDLAKLRSSIYGVGFGLYGFRYGSHFPKHFSKPFPLFPFIDKYPLFHSDWHHYPLSFFPDYFFLEPYYPSISEHVTGFGYPKSYHSSYSHSYEYGRGHSSGHKHSYEYSKPYHYGYYGYPGWHTPPYIKKEYPGDSVIYKSAEPQSHGYEYAWVKKTPEFPKHIPTPEFSGYDPSSDDDLYKDIGKGHLHSKFPVESIDYSELPLKSKDYVLVPSSEVVLAGEDHGDSYSPIYDLKDEKILELKTDDGFHSLGVHNPKNYKFHDSDILAYGSEKSEKKALKKID